MSHISELKLILSQQLNWHKSRIDFFAKALLSLLICRTINLQQLAIAMQSKASTDSRYRRARRFFANFVIDYDDIAKWIFSLFFCPSAKVYIAIDRTNWFLGKAKINIFMLSVCYEGIAIPIYWQLLPKAGSSNAQEQIALVARFIKTFGTHQIKALLADREFPNIEFIAWLKQQNVPFYMRIKEDTITRIGRKKFKSCKQLFAHIKPYEHTVFDMNLTIFGQLLFVAASRNERGELMIVITNSDPKIAIASYLRRWEVECLFQALKGRGFKFEDTHITKLDRVERLLVLMTVALAWAHKTGEWRSKIKPILLKNKFKQKRPQFTFFRYGLDFITDKLTSAHVSVKKFIRFLIPPDPLMESIL